jgi:hypothetical protein
MDYDEYDPSEDLAEQYESSGSSGSGGGAKKKKARPTTVGKRREGSAQSWGTTEKKCPAGCKMKCCATNKSPPIF